MSYLRSYASALSDLGRTYISALSIPLTPADVTIIGCYSNSNAGDNTLGKIVKAILSERGISNTLLSTARLRWYRPSASIIAGGAILTMHSNSPLTILKHTLQRFAKNTAMIGVGGALADPDCDATVLEFLRNVAALSARSWRDVRELQALTGRTDISWQPDLAFALSSTHAKSLGGARRAKTLGINLAPVLMTYSRDNGFRPLTAPSAWFCRHFPEHARICPEISRGYVEFFRRLVSIFRSRGWAVRHIPFTLEDARLASSIWGEGEVECLAYSSHPGHLLEQISRCTQVVATRYHAHVFALVAGVPLLSVAYAPKCQDLWDDLGLSKQATVDLLSLAGNSAGASESLADMEGVIIQPEIRALLSQRVVAIIDRVITTLKLKGHRPAGDGTATSYL